MTSPAMASRTDPKDPSVQAIVRDADALIAQFTGGDPGIARSLDRMYQEQPVEKIHPRFDMKVEKPANNLTPLILTGGDRQLLGQVAANMRALRPPDPYKNKGIRYANEPLRKKAGKTGATGAK